MGGGAPVGTIHPGSPALLAVAVGNDVVTIHPERGRFLVRVTPPGSTTSFPAGEVPYDGDLKGLVASPDQRRLYLLAEPQADGDLVVRVAWDPTARRVLSTEAPFVVAAPEAGASIPSLVISPDGGRLCLLDGRHDTVLLAERSVVATSTVSGVTDRRRGRCEGFGDARAATPSGEQTRIRGRPAPRSAMATRREGSVGSWRARSMPSTKAQAKRWLKKGSVSAKGPISGHASHQAVLSAGTFPPRPPGSARRRPKPEVLVISGGYGECSVRGFQTSYLPASGSRAIHRAT